MTIKKFNMENLPDDFIIALNRCGCFFTSFSWYRLFINTVNPVDYFFLVYEDNNGLDSIILPVRYDTSSCKVLMSLSNFYSPIYQIVQSSFSGSASRCPETFAKELPIPWDVLKLQPMDKNDTDKTVKQLNDSGIPAISFFCFGNWYLEVKGRSYEDYFSGLSSRVKNTVTRKTKKFSAMQNTKLLIISEQQDLDAAISAYNRVYNASWKNEEAYPDFISGLCRLAAAEGALRLGFAYINDVAVAAQLWIVADNTAYIYKLAYDEAYKNYAVGSILTAKLMQHVIDVDKVEVVDYLTGDDAYKKDWMSHRRERWGVLAFNTSSIRGAWAMIKELSKYCLKKAWTSLNGLLTITE